MRTTNESSVLKILWGSFVTALLLTVLETCFVGLVQVVVQASAYGNASGLAGVNPFLSIAKGTAFILLMRILLGFVWINSAIWALMAFMRLRLPLALVCMVNGASVFVMYCIWDWKYHILHDLFYLKKVADCFGWYQTGLLSALIVPIAFQRIRFRLNILPAITRGNQKTSFPTIPTTG